MTINTIIGLISALIGSTATLLGAWAYIRSKHPTRKELLRGVGAVLVIMMCILGFAVAVSRATAVNVDSKATPTVSTSPTVIFLAPGQIPSSPTVTPTQGSTVTHSPTSMPTPASTSISLSTPTPASTPISSSTPASSSPPAASSSTPTSHN